MAKPPPSSTHVPYPMELLCAHRRLADVVNKLEPGVTEGMRWDVIVHRAADFLEGFYETDR